MQSREGVYEGYSYLGATRNLEACTAAIYSSVSRLYLYMGVVKQEASTTVVF